MFFAITRKKRRSSSSTRRAQRPFAPSPFNQSTTTVAALSLPTMSEKTSLSKKEQLGRDKSMKQEAQSFLERNKSCPYSSRAPSHTPTLEEIKNTSFQEYVRDILFGESSCTKQGMAKVTLPPGFSTSSQELDTTARGSTWQKGTDLGDFMIQGPIKQCLSGIGGVYEYTLLDEKALPLYEFRDKADAYQKRQLGSVVTEKETMDDAYCDALAHKFWKRLGPTMESSMYGADMEGSLFSSGDDACGWNPGALESCLQLLSADTDGRSLPGVTTPYLYFGMWASVFCA